jgi:hypothetical protein
MQHRNHNVRCLEELAPQHDRPSALLIGATGPGRSKLREFDVRAETLTCDGDVRFDLPSSERKVSCRGGRGTGTHIVGRASLSILLVSATAGCPFAPDVQVNLVDGSAAVRTDAAWQDSDSSVEDLAGTGLGPCRPDLTSILEAPSLEKYRLEFLALGQPVAGSVALHEGTVFWGNGYSRGQVRSISLADCIVREVAPDINDPKNLVTDEGALYWVEAGTARLMRFDFASGAVRVLGQSGSRYGLVPLGDSIYSLGEGCAVTSIPKSGGPSTTLTASISEQPRFIAGDGNSLFIGCENPNSMFEFRPGDGAIHRLPDRPQRMTALAVNGARVVWGEATCPSYLDACYPRPSPGCCGGRIMSYERATGATSTVAIDTTSPPFTITMDGDRLWWSNLAEVRAIRIGEMNSTLVANDQAIVDAIAVDATYVYWANPRRAGDLQVLPGYIVRTARER